MGTGPLYIPVSTTTFAWHMNNSLNQYVEKNKIEKSELRVFCYGRFSSLKQAKGTSLARQHESAKAWCDENGVKLDESVKFEDKGKSAFSGKNAESGELAVIMKMLASGEIAEGSVLLVEAFDRLTRMDIQQGISELNLQKSGRIAGRNARCWPVRWREQRCAVKLKNAHT